MLTSKNLIKDLKGCKMSIIYSEKVLVVRFTVKKYSKHNVI